MRRHISAAIVGVCALLLIALGIPLAVVVHRTVFDSEVVELQATAARTLVELGAPFDIARIAVVRNEPDAPPPFDVYDVDGKLVSGDGPTVADLAVQRALTGNTASTTTGRIVVATPIHDGVTEAIVGALRLSESRDGANRRTRVAWAIMAATGAGALALAWLIANRVARRLSQPVIDLAAAATRIGDGGVVEPIPHSGIVEIDTLAAAFTESARRVNEALARERRFSADVSHQLRTPLAGLRLHLESPHTRIDPSQAIDAALQDLTRVEQTVDHLLAVARDSMPTSSTVQLDEAARQAAGRWAHRAAAQDRRIVTGDGTPVATRGSAASVEQSLDVLIDNALRHGDGTISLTWRHLPGGGALDVTDEGQQIASFDIERIFERRQGHDTGIGLALAVHSPRLMAAGCSSPISTQRPSPSSFSTPTDEGPGAQRRRLSVKPLIS